MNSWIFGDSALHKITAVHEKFIENRIRTSKIYLVNYPVFKYHPILSDEKVYRQVDTEIICDLQNLRPFDLSFSAQSLRKSVYENFEFLEWFSNKESGVSVDTEILSFEPTAEVEVRESLELIQISCPWMRKLFDRVIYELCFVLKDGQRRFTGGASDYRLLGTIFCNLKQKPFNILELAICLAHELGHQALMIYQTGQDPISEESHNTFVYSGVRKVDRPIYGSFHALVALGYMSEFCLGLVNSDKIDSSIARQSEELSKEYLADLRDGLLAMEQTQFRPIGKVIMKDLIALARKDLS